MENKLHLVSGVTLGVAVANIKKNGSTDMVAISLAQGTRTAATFTQNAFCAAPVTLAKAHLAHTAARVLLINSGNANAGTGKQGMADAVKSCQWVAQASGCALEAVLPFSTGVIGENLPMDKFVTGVPAVLKNLTEDAWAQAAQGIMTTDLVSKTFSRQVDIDGALVTFTGMSKGSGMIHPNMATMLGFCATDAKISQSCLQKALTDAVNVSFNRITVDGDTSTNDACTLSATQQCDMAEITDTQSAAYVQFAGVVKDMMTDLAQKIIRDGEGATKFVTIEVNTGQDSAECLLVANTIALSPLVKTALFASDPNWGRILAAVGRAGVVNLDIDSLEIWLGGVCIVKEGGRASGYTEEAGQAVMNETDINITVKLNRGNAVETIWTTDFSYDYVKINAEYRS